MRKASVYLRERRAGILEELDRGYRFSYIPAYVQEEGAEPISLTLPLQLDPYVSEPTLHPFFDGLIPEGWLLQLALGVHRLQLRDRFGILLATGADTIGAVRILPSE